MHEEAKACNFAQLTNLLYVLVTYSELIVKYAIKH